VLIVDDDSSKRLAIKAVLSTLGLQVVEADSGLSALRCVMERDFAVILLDVRMPEIDGFETAALIRRRKESEMTPIIFITAFTSDEIASKAKYVQGAVDFMTAPVSPDELRAKVSVFVNLYLHAQQLALQAKEVQESANQLGILTDVAPVGIFRTDADNKYIYTNARWSEISGISAEDAQGRVWDTIFASTAPPGAPEDEFEPSRVGRRFRLWATDSTSRVVWAASEPIQDQSGGTLGWVGTLIDVTAEAEAEKERTRFRSLVQNSRDVIAIIDPTGGCCYASPGVEELTGTTADEFQRLSDFAFIHPEDVEATKAHVLEVSANANATKTFETRVLNQEGSSTWVEMRVANGLELPSINGIVLNFHDISERREATTQLARSATLLAEGQSLSHLGSFTWDMRTNLLAWSDEQYRLLGFDPGVLEPSFETLVARIHHEDRAAFLKGTEDSATSGVPFALDFRVVHPGGDIRWIHCKGEVQSEDGIPVRLVGMSHDITERKLAETVRLKLMDQQHELATLLRMLLDSTGEGIYGLDPHGDCTFMNKAGAELLGGAAEFFIGNNMHSLTHHSHPDGSDYPAEDCPLQQGLKTGKPYSAQGDVVWRLDGTRLPVDFSAHPIEENGQIAGSVITFQDVTLRLGMEEELRQSEQLFRGAFDASQIGTSLTMADGLTYVDVNQSLCDMLGYTKAELMELNWQKLTHPDDLQRNLKEHARLVEGLEDVDHVEKRYVGKAGNTIWIEVNDAVIRGTDGRPRFFVTHINDVTERHDATSARQALETQLVQSQKMEAVGQLAGGVAHDFNNILSVILNYAQFASEGLEKADPRLIDIQEIIKAGEKAARLVHQLLAFSRKEIVEQIVIDPNEVVTGIFSILSRALGEDIALDFDKLEGISCVCVDPGRLEQVLLNLAVNARDAMPNGGLLHIATDKLSLAAGDIPPLPAGDYAVISVRDSGSGMDVATMERIFEPFFTTKPRGEGTGMGLSSAYGIIEQAGGSLRVESELGVGTKFSIYLPCSDVPYVAPIADELPRTVRGEETILLVEDEDAVRDIVSRILTAQGYQVIPCSSGSDALEYFRENPSAVDLLLTDVVMPKMSGKELSDKATAIDRGLKTLFMSGYTDALIAQRGVLASDEELLAKPFNPDELLISVRSMLDKSAA
jgi:PAS domain S-box-containing protein